MTTTNSAHKDSTQRSINDIEEVHKRVTSKIAEALLEDHPVLLDALPATGKSHGLIKAVNQTSEPVTIFTHRGREEQYEAWCSDLGLTCKTLAAADETCPTFRGDHGKKWRQQVTNLRNAGASAGHIHGRLDIPCQTSKLCPYEKAVDFDPDDYDVLVGHPKHAYVCRYLENRIPVFDEFPGEAYLTKIENTAEVVTSFLQDHKVSFRNYADLLQDRDDASRRRNALEQLQELSLIDKQQLFKGNHSQRHKLAGLCVLTLLQSTDLDNGWESAILDEVRIGVFDRDSNTVHILNPPNLPGHALGLDGTPTKPMWDLALGFYDRRQDLVHQQVLNESERQEYITAIQDLQIIPTTTNVRPYSGGTTNPTRDAGLLHKIMRHHAKEMGVVSSKRGLSDLKEEFEGIDKWKTAYFGNLLGSNKLSDVDVGVILGSTHYGDRELKKWAALAGITAEPNNEQGRENSYGKFGDKVLRHMREHRVLQALFRFARQGDGATVYVDTICLPDWVPVSADPEDVEIDTWSPAQLDVIEALKQLNEGRTKEVASQSGRVPRTVRGVLRDISDSVVSARKAEDGRGGAKVWVNEGLDSLSPHGQVGLPEPRSPTRFSEQSPYRDSKGSVPKKTSHQLRVQREKTKRAEFERRRKRWFRKNQMKEWYGSS